ncbi:glycosyltransferase family 2 protein [Aquimixticola soesokkakensis]|uniref:glycosyltransferase family 2 protein n=1 Tax=Aquimixticola soesokkakensis TaxID=1519096 RepID=UPI00190ECA07|nr:glycosyltransferase family 2 protein [Aquimixticola soesokkakensis]
MRTLAVLTVRNEGAFLLDWLAHHRAVGFTDFLVLSNDCDDGTDALLDRLHAMGEITHLPNPAPHLGGIQFAGLKRADKHPLLREVDWILALDVDEFVNIHTGDGTLGALHAALPDADAITLTWRLFGNGGVAQYLDTPVPDQFRRAAPVEMNWPWRASMFKTLYRNDGQYRKLGVHRPRALQKGAVPRWVDGCGRSLSGDFLTKRLFSPFGRDNYQLVQLNHYPLGAMASYILKCDRGRAVHDADRLGMDYWVERNWCVEEDNSISRYTPARDAIRTALASDPVLADLHTKAVAWRHARFGELMESEPLRALFGRLVMTPPSQPVPQQVARYLFRFARNGRAKAASSNKAQQ